MIKIKSRQKSAGKKSFLSYRKQFCCERWIKKKQQQELRNFVIFFFKQHVEIFFLYILTVTLYLGVNNLGIKAQSVEIYKQIVVVGMIVLFSSLTIFFFVFTVLSI